MIPIAAISCIVVIAAFFVEKEVFPTTAISGNPKRLPLQFGQENASVAQYENGAFLLD